MMDDVEYTFGPYFESPEYVYICFLRLWKQRCMKNEKLCFDMLALIQFQFNMYSTSKDVWIIGINFSQTCTAAISVRIPPQVPDQAMDPSGVLSAVLPFQCFHVFNVYIFFYFFL